jgi:hypothetical protein
MQLNKLTMSLTQSVSLHQPLIEVSFNVHSLSAAVTHGIGKGNKTTVRTVSIVQLYSYVAAGIVLSVSSDTCQSRANKTTVASARPDLLCATHCSAVPQPTTLKAIRSCVMLQSNNYLN